MSVTLIWIGPLCCTCVYVSINCLQVLHSIIFAQAVVMLCKKWRKLLWFFSKKNNYVKLLPWSNSELPPGSGVRVTDDPAAPRATGKATAGSGGRGQGSASCNLTNEITNDKWSNFKFLTVWVGALADKVGLLGVAVAVDPPHAGAALAPHAPLNNFPQTLGIGTRQDWWTAVDRVHQTFSKVKTDLLSQNSTPGKIMAGRMMQCIFLQEVMDPTPKINQEWGDHKSQSKENLIIKGGGGRDHWLNKKLATQTVANNNAHRAIGPGGSAADKQ